MLTPEYLSSLPDGLLELYAQIEADILIDMAERINAYDLFIPSAQFQLEKLEDMGYLRADIIRDLQRVSGKAEDELAEIMREAGMKALLDDDAIYRAAGRIPPPLSASPLLQEIFRAGMDQTGGLFRNLTRTTAAAATRQYEQALDRAYMQVISGAFSPSVAIRNAIKDLSRQGVNAIVYPSGRTDSLEVAVRRAVVTGVNQTTLRMQMTRADEMGCDLVEVSAHSGARPDHAEWQGKIYSRRGKTEEYPDFVDSTGFGSGEGLGGWNCGHTARPYFEGMPRTYSPEQLEEYNAKNYEYNGEKMTEYEAIQRQRGIERSIRRWKRENLAMNAAGLDTTESARKLSQWQQTKNDFLQQTGLKRQADREFIAGWGRSEAASAAQAARGPDIYADFMKANAARSVTELLPRYSEAIIPDAKLTGYALNKDHKTGKHKAIVFERALGYTTDNKDDLISAVQMELAKVRARQQSDTQYGKPFRVTMMIKGANGRYAKVQTGWIIDHGETVPRLITIYVD